MPFLSPVPCRWRPLGLALLLAWPAFAGRTVVRLGPAPKATFELAFDGEAQVLFFPQVHESDDLDAKGKIQVLVSQFALATFLQENPGYAVFVEGRHDLGPKDAATLPNGTLDGVFPEGRVPATLRLTTPRQNSALIRVGAPEVLFRLKRLPELHGAMPADEGRRIDQAILAHLAKPGVTFATLDKEGLDLVLGQREKAAAATIRAFLARNPGRKVLLVFGAAHDFRPHFAGLRYGVVSGMEHVIGLEESKEDKAIAPASLEAPPRTALMKAAAEGDVAAVRAQVRSGADPRAVDALGFNALILAARGNHLEALKALLPALRPEDVRAPVCLGEGGMLRTFEDVIALLEEESGLAKDHFAAILLLKAYAPETPKPRSPKDPARGAPDSRTPDVILGGRASILPSRY